MVIVKQIRVYVNCRTLPFKHTSLFIAQQSQFVLTCAVFQVLITTLTNNTVDESPVTLDTLILISFSIVFLVYLLRRMLSLGSFWCSRKMRSFSVTGWRTPVGLIPNNKVTAMAVLKSGAMPSYKSLNCYFLLLELKLPVTSSVILTQFSYTINIYIYEVTLYTLRLIIKVK